MLEKISESITAFFLRNQLIETDQKEIFEYRIQKLIGTSFSACLTLIISLLLHRFFETVCYLVFFCWLRSRSGGFHAKSFFQCVLCSEGIYLISALLIFPILELSPWPVTMLLLFLSSLLVWILAPVNHPNIAWDEGEFQESKKRTRIILGIQVLLTVVGYWIPIFHSCAVFMCCSIFSASALVGAAKIIKQEVSAK